MEEMKRQLEFAVRQEQRCRKELEEARRSKTDLRSHFEASVQDLRQQKLKLETGLQEVSDPWQCQPYPGSPWCPVTARQ